MKPDKNNGVEQNSALSGSKSSVRTLDSASFLLRLKEVIGDRPVASFARECRMGESTLRNILAGAWPRTDILVSIADCGGVSVDWLAAGREPKKLTELRALVKAGSPLRPGGAEGETYRLALKVVQEWQVDNARLLPVDKFLRAVELLTELASDSPEQLKKHAAQVLRLAA